MLRYALAGVLTVGLSTAVAAQDMNQQFFVEVRGGINVPTFDIADAADPGLSLGGTFGVMVAPKVWLMAEGDFGDHSGANGGGDIKVYHYMAKVGYNVFQNESVSILVNAGAGAMTFRPDGGGSDTYVAINVGGKIAFAVSEQIAIVVSPQGDIAFSDDPSTSWVWPFSAGLRVGF